jgi:hypothetical protein
VLDCSKAALLVGKVDVSVVSGEGRIRGAARGWVTETRKTHGHNCCYKHHPKT